MTTADPTRSPAGTEALWAYTHVRSSPTRTPAGRDPRGLGPRRLRALRRPDAGPDREVRGFASRVLARQGPGPREMEARDANLVGGALGAGTSSSTRS